MQSNAGGGGGFYSIEAALNDPSFCSVLTEIFEQTQLEIQASNNAQNEANLVVAPPPLLPPPTPIPAIMQQGVDNDLFSSGFYDDETLRYEPLVDPALNYISSILAEEDGDYGGGVGEVPCVTMDEFLAWQRKTEEMTTLLKEDPPIPSPTLGLPFSPEAGSSEDSSSQGTNNNLMQAKEVGPSSDSHRGSRAKKATTKVLKPRKEVARKKSGGVGTHRGRSSKEGGPEHEFVDVNDLLQQVSQAAAAGNLRNGMETLKKIKQHADARGDGARRLAYYFAEALEARFSGTGWPLYLGLLRHRPSAAEVLRAIGGYMAHCPFIKASHYFINQTILDAARAASRLYIMELQMSGGFHYPSLFKALSERPGGPPLVKMIGIGFPNYSVMADHTAAILEGVEKTGRQLSSFAASCGVPFEFTAWAGTRESLDMHAFIPVERDESEVFVIISANLLRYVMDELDSPDTRHKLLRMGHSLKPEVYIQGVVTGAYNTPFFTRRFKEALFYFESLFDVLDTFVGRESPERMVFESEILGKAILNIVACEGAEVVERIDKYRQWRRVTEEAGFCQLPLNEGIRNNVHTMLSSWHKEYTVAEDSQYMLLGWKGRMLYAMSTWNAPESRSRQAG